MKLVDVMSNAGLSMYAIVALVLFVSAFVVVVIMTFAPGTKAKHARLARLPLDDEAPGSAPRTEE
jgi:cbb3-type cytochrome oxidase subunit 3